MMRRVEYLEPADVGYDMGTKLWTSFLGIVIAAIIDWFAVVVPARDHKNELHMGAWNLALVIALIAPAAWLIGRLMKKDWAEAVIWVVFSSVAVVFQLVVLTWGQS